MNHPSLLFRRALHPALSVCCAAALSGGTIHAADLVQTFDRLRGVVRIHIESEAGRTLAEFSQPGPAPASCTSGPRLVPASAVARLRDQLDREWTDTREAEARSAGVWMRALLAARAEAPAEQLDGEFVLLPAGVTTSWCGSKLDSRNQCPNDCVATTNPRDCAGCGCAATREPEPKTPPKLDPTKP